MKKVLYSILLLTASCQLSYAKTVDVNTAKTIGSNFLNEQGKSVKATDMALAYEASSVINGATVTDFYIFNADGGFVIVSADDKVMPVLAFGLDEAFTYNKIHVNTNDWINNYKNQVNAVITGNSAANASVQQQWTALATAHSSANRTTTNPLVGPLVKTKWNQSPNVNNLCPYVAADSAYCVTGCVSTSMSQVMKYWNWPVTGTGNHSYRSPYGTLSANFAADTFQWSAMPLVVTDTNYMAVAKLMAATGISVNMGYSDTESGAGFDIASNGPICAEAALPTYFQYMQSTIQALPRADYDDSDWVHLIRAEIDAKRPVLYDGFGPEGGHAFIADGYSKATNFLHFNWGWGGQDDGYYSVENLAPGGTAFNDGQHVIVGIMPDTVSLTPVVPTPSGVQQIAANSAVVIYPNPATNVINISLNGTVASEIRIMDMQGRVVSSVTPATATLVAITVADLADGLYIVQLQTAKGIITKKITIAK